MTEELCPEEWIAQEESVKERTDKSGVRWRKVYFGGGTHFANWLEQFREVYGEENIEVEALDSTGGPACFERSGEGMVRIWAKITE